MANPLRKLASLLKPERMLVDNMHQITLDAGDDAAVLLQARMIGRVEMGMEECTVRGKFDQTSTGCPLQARVRVEMCKYMQRD